MPTPMALWLEKASFTTDDLEGDSKGGMLSNAQARVFLRDAIEATAILSNADVTDSASKKYEVPKLSFNDRIMRAGVSGSRVADEDRAKPKTGLISLSTELFKGEVETPDELYEDNVEAGGLADTLMQMIAEAVGRDLEEIAIKSDPDSAVDEFAQLEDGGLIYQLVNDVTAIDVDASAVTAQTATGILNALIKALPSKYRRNLSSLVAYVTVEFADVYAEELAARIGNLGDTAQQDDVPLRRRGVKIVPVPLLSGSDTVKGSPTNFETYAVLCDPKNCKVGFHRRVRVEKFRDPREGNTSYLPNVRMDAKWAAPEAIVLASKVPALPVPAGS